MNNLLKKYFDNLYKSNRMSHAFLIGNSNYDNLKDELSQILSDYFFDSKINIDEALDIYIVKPQNGKILKEQILNLQENLSRKSQFNDNKVYIIDEAQLMNDYAANSLLKTLEEPEKNIYAFLISNNIDNVLPTIKSRCQVLMINNKNIFNLDKYEKEFLDKALNIVVCIENYRSDSLAYIYDFINKKIDKEEFKEIFRVIKYIYRDILNYKLFSSLIYFKLYIDDIIRISNKNSEDVLVNKLIILNRAENMLEYNLNLNLFLDKLIIEMEMLINE